MASERYLTLLIAFHITALGLAAIPSRAAPPRESPRRTDSTLSAFLTPPMRRVAAVAETLEAAMFRGTAPIRTVTATYVGLGLAQHWEMFAHPPTTQRFVRLDHYVRLSSAGSSVTVVREVVYPSLPEDQLRWRYRPLDKATSTSVESFLSTVAREEYPGEDVDTGSGIPAEAHLTPLLRYFRSRTLAGLEEPGGIARTEIWRGEAAMPLPGAELDYAPRQRVLAHYRSGERNGPASMPYPSLGTTVHEADVTWRLVFVDRP